MAKPRPIYIIYRSLGYYLRRRFAGGAQRVNKNGRPATHRWYSGRLFTPEEEEQYGKACPRHG